MLVAVQPGKNMCGDWVAEGRREGEESASRSGVRLRRRCRDTSGPTEAFLCFPLLIWVMESLRHTLTKDAPSIEAPHFVPPPLSAAASRGRSDAGTSVDCQLQPGKSGPVNLIHPLRKDTNLNTKKAARLPLYLRGGGAGSGGRVHCLRKAQFNLKDVN